jgi:hypothetical protein
VDEWSRFLTAKELLWLSVRVSSSHRHGCRYAQIDRICTQDGDAAIALSSTPNTSAGRRAVTNDRPTTLCDQSHLSFAPT